MSTGNQLSKGYESFPITPSEKEFLLTLRSQEAADAERVRVPAAYLELLQKSHRMINSAVADLTYARNLVDYLDLITEIRE